MPKSLRDRIDIKTLEATEPIQAVVAASEAVDLTIAGTSRAWSIERHTLGRYTDELVPQGGSQKSKVTHSKVLWNEVFRDFKW